MTKRRLNIAGKHSTVVIDRISVEFYRKKPSWRIDGKIWNYRIELFRWSRFTYRSASGWLLPSIVQYSTTGNKRKYSESRCSAFPSLVSVPQRRNAEQSGTKVSKRIWYAGQLDFDVSIVPYREIFKIEFGHNTLRDFTKFDGRK